MALRLGQFLPRLLASQRRTRETRETRERERDTPLLALPRMSNQRSLCHIIGHAPLLNKPCPSSPGAVKLYNHAQQLLTDSLAGSAVLHFPSFLLGHVQLPLRFFQKKEETNKLVDEKKTCASWPVFPCPCLLSIFATYAYMWSTKGPLNIEIVILIQGTPEIRPQILSS